MAADKAREAKDAPAEKVKQGTEATTQKLGEYKDYAAEKAREGKESAAEKAIECKDYAAEKARETKELAAEKAKQANETAEDKEKARRAMEYVEDKEEETKEKARETTETVKEKARQEMEEMKLREEDRDELELQRLKKHLKGGRAIIFSAIGNVTGTIKEKLMGAKNAAENKQEVSELGAGEPVFDKDGDGVVGARTVLVIDKGTKFDDVAQTLREASQVTAQTFNDVGKIAGEDVVMTDPKK